MFSKFSVVLLGAAALIANVQVAEVRDRLFQHADTSSTTLVQ